MTLYADMLFLVNFIMNGFVLWMLKKITRQRIGFRWLALGAGLMALLYTLLIAVPALRFVNIVLASVVILAVGVAAAFRPPSVSLFVKFMAIAYVISFAVGGLGMALFFLTDLPHAVYFIVSDMSGFSRAISWQVALVGMATSYIVIKLGTKMSEHITLRRQMLCSVLVTIGKNDCRFDALVDTGHNLREPLSKMPVIIAEYEQIKPLLPECLNVLFAEKMESDLTVLLSVREEEFYSRIRMIPFASLGRNNGMLIGFRPDSIQVEGQSEASEAIIGIYNSTLCKNGRYRGLLSPEIVA